MISRVIDDLDIDEKVSLAYPDKMSSDHIIGDYIRFDRQDSDDYNDQSMNERLSDAIKQYSMPSSSFTKTINQDYHSEDVSHKTYEIG